MRRTRKWSFVSQEATRLAGLGLSPAEIAERIEVNKSTVTRWMASGKLPRTTAEAAKADRAETFAQRPGQSPAAWAAAVRAEYALDATDEQLVHLGEEALAIARNAMQTTAARMSATTRFQAIVKQLRLVARRDAEAQPSAKPHQEAAAPTQSPAPRARVVRSSGDPRAMLQAVK